MDNTVTHPGRRHLPAADLRPGVRVAAGFLPLMKAAEIVFAYVYTLHGVSRVCVVYLYDGDGQPAPDDFLAGSLIPVEVSALHTLTDRIRAAGRS